MPELPEVETIKRELDKILCGKIISGVEILWSKTVSPTTAINLTKIITDKRIISLERRAKMLIIHLNNNVSLIFHFKDKSNLYFNDLRKFGWVKIF